MRARQRWNDLMHFRPVDHVPDEEFGYWSDTLDAWHSQGLPAWVADNSKADYFFGFAPRSAAPVNVGLLPGFQHQVLEETRQHQIVLDGNGVIDRRGERGFRRAWGFPGSLPRRGHDRGAQQQEAECAEAEDVTSFHGYFSIKGYEQRLRRCEGFSLPTRQDRSRSLDPRGPVGSYRGFAARSHQR